MDDLHDDSVDSLMNSSSLPLWFSQGHIRDDLAIEMQAQMTPTANVTFLTSQEKPQIGMRTESIFHTLEGASFRMSGVITAIGDEPTPQELTDANDSLLWKILSTTPKQHFHPMVQPNLATLQDKKNLLIALLGSVHGQRIKSIATLTEPVFCPLTSDAIVEIDFVYNDHMYYPWIVDTFRVVDKSELQQLQYRPQPHLMLNDAFEGCACPRCYFKDGILDNYVKATPQLQNHKEVFSTQKSNHFQITKVQGPMFNQEDVKMPAISCSNKAICQENEATIFNSTYNI